jgi:sulfate adenylyltransferase
MYKTSLTLTDRQLCDLELLLNGGFAPLNGFMSQKDYNSVLNEMRLSNGSIWTIPINLDVSKDFAERINHNEKILLKDKEGFSIAILTITDIWEPNLKNESKKIYNTTDPIHPGVNYLINKTNRFYLGGLLEKISDPKHYDYKEYRHTPKQLRDVFKKLKWKKVIAFQTRNPLHRAHVEMIKNAIKNENANLLLHPVVGMTKPGDVNHFTRLRCYQSVLKRFDQKQAILSLIPLAMRMAGPREAVWHALIRKNYGCSQLIVGRDHAGPGLAESGKPFYGPYDAQKLLIQHQNEIGIEMIPFKFMVFLPNLKSYKPIDKIKNSENYKTISGTELRKMLDNGQKIPSWFTYPEVARELERSTPPLHKRGITIFFTGLSGSGKSTLANGLMVKLLEEGSRTVTLLDGDIVRTHLSNELGFSKEHRSINVQRIGYVASEITKNKGIAICAPIAPYEIDRNINRDLISSYGGYIEIFVNTPLKKCEERDSKGLYKLARKGIIKEFTGISDPYEKPLNPEIIIDSSNQNPEELVDVLYNKIQQLGYLK